MKYLFIREPDGAEFPFLFCAPITHREAATMLLGQRHGREVASAGFVEFAAISPRMTGENCGQTPGGQQAETVRRAEIIPRCFGASTTLGIVSRPESDSAHLAAFTRATLESARITYGPALVAST